MKCPCALVLCLVLLTGCSKTSDEMERGMELRRKLLCGRECSFTATVTADYGDSIQSFTLDCIGDEQGNLTFSLVEPESIAGITGTVSDEGGTLTFDDSAVCFALLADGQVTPVSGPWILLKTLREGYLASAGREGEYIRLSAKDSYGEDALQVDIWLDEQAVPMRAEILYRQRRILSLDITNFEIL